MPGQALRKKSVRQKLNPIKFEFKDKNVLLIDDSIVRGTTSREIVQMARDAGASKVFFASAAPPVKFANVYGIDMPTLNELIAHERDANEISNEIGADGLIYQSLEDLKFNITKENSTLMNFDCSCFDGKYVTELRRSEQSTNEKPSNPSAQLDLNLINSSVEEIDQEHA